jgi:hypothetical protein
MSYQLQTVHFIAIITPGIDYTSAKNDGRAGTEAYKYGNNISA